MEFTENLRKLLQVEEHLSLDTRLKINEHAKNLLNDLTPSIAAFLNEDLDADKHSEDDVRNMIQSNHNALAYDKDLAELPIQRASRTLKNAHFIPVFAEEGSKHNIGGEGMRGGLLCKRNSDGGLNTLQYLVMCNAIDQNFDDNNAQGTYVGIFTKLRELNLFHKDDIRKHDLLWWSGMNFMKPKNGAIFEYLVNWDPIAMKERDNRGRTLLHRFAIDAPLDVFLTKFKAGLKQFPDGLGLLFEKGNNGNSVLLTVREHYGYYSPLYWSYHWKLIERCLEEQGSKILRKNPKNNTYPFMLAASGDTSDLDTLYCLLRWDPMVLNSAIKREQPECKKRRHS